jgi:CheY-like chemotaxis protein
LKFFLASDLEGLRRLYAVLAEFDFRSAFTLDDALRILDSPMNFDLIIIGVHFDDSRAVDLLREIRSKPKYELTPILFIRTQPSSISQILEQSILSLKDAYRVNGLIETDLLDEDDCRIREEIVRMAALDI